MLYTRSVTILAQGHAGHESHCGSGVLLYSVQRIHGCQRHSIATERVGLQTEFYCAACNGCLRCRRHLRRLKSWLADQRFSKEQNKEKQNHCAALKWNVRERSALVAELSSSTTATAAAARAAVANLLLQRSLFRYTLEPRSKEDGKCISRR